MSAAVRSAVASRESRLTSIAIFIRETFWVFALGAILAYLFFMVLGRVRPGGRDRA